MNLLERNRGALLGLAAGDAVGTTLEFRAPGTFQPIDDMVGGGPFDLAPGQWTDDTSMALCLAASLVETGRFLPADQMDRYLRWYRAGYFSSTGACFDIGNTVRGALLRYEREGEPYAGSTDPQSAGNGSLMRLAPVPLRYAADPAAAIARAADSSRTTHGAPAAVDACRYFAGLLLGALAGEPKGVLLEPHYAPLPGLWEAQPLQADVAAVAAGSFKTRRPPAIRGTGYVVRSLEAALWAFHTTNNFREGALAAANLGDDADTTAAIYGQLAGAYYGADGIPGPWLARLAERDTIRDLADALYALAQPARVRLRVMAGDITQLPVDAVVNAANGSLLGGGGVDGAIHRAAGPELLAYCRTLGGCATGAAKVTPGFRLPARHVIHTVGPRWSGGNNQEDDLLVACYRHSLALAAENGARTVAFPAISTGIYGFPGERAAAIAARTCADFLAADDTLAEVLLVAFDPQTRALLERAVRAYFAPE